MSISHTAGTTQLVSPMGGSGGTRKLGSFRTFDTTGKVEGVAGVWSKKVTIGSAGQIGAFGKDGESVVARKIVLFGMSFLARVNRRTRVPRR
jgi:hypothetical protein